MPFSPLLFSLSISPCSLWIPSSPTFCPFLPATTAPRPPYSPALRPAGEGTCRRSTERFPKSFSIIATFIICISSFSFVGARCPRASCGRCRSSLLSFSHVTWTPEGLHICFLQAPISQMHPEPPKNTTHIISHINTVPKNTDAIEPSVKAFMYYLLVAV